jgi:hypothetical protein
MRQLLNIKFLIDDVHDVNIRAPTFFLVVNYRNIVKFWLRITKFYLQAQENHFLSKFVENLHVPTHNSPNISSKP